MADITLCEHRRVELGRLYCDIASRGGERATDETYNRTCELCRVASIRAAHPCVHLDIGIDLTEHRDRSTLDAYHVACLVKKTDVGEADACTPEECSQFEAVAEEKRAQYEAAARTLVSEESRDTLQRGPSRLDL